MKVLIKYWLILLVALSFAGCQGSGDLDSNSVPKKLVIGVVQAEGFDQIKKAREEIRKFLEKRLGMPVEMIMSTDYNSLIEALKAHKIDMADLPPFAYVVATRAMKLTPIATLGNNGKPSSYHSVIIVNSNSSIKTMSDLKANAKKLSFAFVEPASASGHLIPRAYLNTIGLNPDTAFKQVIFAGNHPAAVLSVKSSKVDAGCTTDLVFNIMIKQKMLSANDIRVLWTSPPIVTDPIVVRGDINKDFAKKVQQAYVDMNTRAPQIIQNYVKIFLKDTTRRSYIAINDSLYNGLRKIAAGVKELKLN